MGRSIILVMVVSYAVSAAILFWTRDSDHATALRRDTRMPAGAMAPPPPSAPPALPQPPPALPPLPLARNHPSVPVAIPGPEADPPVADAAPQLPLPVAAHVRKRRGLGGFEGEVTNVSADALSIQLRTVDAANQTEAEITLTLASTEKKSFSTDDGLILQGPGTLVIHNPQYRDQVLRIP